MTPPFAEAAAQLAAMNIAVFPLRPRTKAPYGRTIGLHMASADVETARARWAGASVLPLQPIEVLRAKNPKRSDAWLLRPVKAGPFANIAIATGAPAGFWVLDEDGEEASAWIAAREAEHGPLPDTVEQLTARGRHRCFAWDEAAQAADIPNRSRLVGAPLDVRGAGGYIVVAPSIHPGDEKKGVPPGFVYRWREGHAPWDRPFAPAPAWLIALVKPVEAAPVVVKPHVRVEGQASPYGEAALDRAVGTIQSARVGSRDSTLYAVSCSIGRLVAGGEIDEAYARSALEGAGRVHVPDAMNEAQLVRQVDRALAFGAQSPKTAPERRDARAATPRRADVAPTPAEKAAAANDARGLWREAQSADCGAVRTWLKLRGLPHAGDWAAMALGALRAHPSAPVNGRGDRLPALLAPMGRPDFDAAFGDEPDCVAVLPLSGGRGGIGADRFVWFVGDATGKAVVIAPPVEGQLLVTLDLKDAWALGAASVEGEDPMGVAITPTLSAFCGGALVDRFGRVSVETPRSDPAVAPWALKDQALVYLAARGDLTTPELKVRKVGGGTRRAVLSGDEAHRFCGGLAEQAWRREGANRVRLLKPGHGHGYHTVAGRAA